MHTLRCSLPAMEQQENSALQISVLTLLLVNNVNLMTSSSKWTTIMTSLWLFISSSIDCTSITILSSLKPYLNWKPTVKDLIMRWEKTIQSDTFWKHILILKFCFLMSPYTVNIRIKLQLIFMTQSIRTFSSPKEDFNKAPLADSNRFLIK